MFILTSLWNGLQYLGSVVFPFFGKPARGPGAVVRWVLHILVVLLLLVLLWFLNDVFDLSKVLRSPFPRLHRVWLPLLFLLVYVLLWMGVWLWRLLGPEHLSAEYPEIDDAWEEARAALHQANIDLTEVPLFVVLGRPLDREEALFQAAKMPWSVLQAPRGDDAPLHVYATREAIFVTCAPSSALGGQARLWAEETGTPSTAARLAEIEEKVETLMRQLQEQNRAPTKEEEKQLSDWQSETETLETLGGSSASLLKNKEAVENLQNRLDYLCRVILRERRPYCPINGVLVLAPVTAWRSDTEASQLAMLAHADLQIVQRVFQLDCPVEVLVTDLHRLQGFREFAADLSAAQRDLPLGQSFPLMPDMEVAEVAPMFEAGISSFCRGSLARAVIGRMRVEPGLGDAPGRPGLALRNNFRLYQFWNHLQQTRKRFARLAQRCGQSVDGGPPMVAGCYLAGTGLDAGHDQAFVPAVFRLLIHNQNYVAWTPVALAEDRSYRRLARLGYVFFLLLLVALGFLVWWFWPRNST